METKTVEIEPPAELVTTITRLKQCFPFRICWGSFDPKNPADCYTGADFTKRKFNDRLRKGHVGFIL